MKWSFLPIPLLVAFGSLPGAAYSEQPTAEGRQDPPVLSCEHANAPTDPYIGWADKDSGAFLLRCLLFADRTGVAFQITYRSPQAGESDPGSVIGGGWGTDFDDFARRESGGRVVIRNGADGSVDTYAPERRGSPLLVAGNSADQRERRAQACEYVEHEGPAGLRRAFCDRTIQHFGEDGRLIRYSTHALHQMFELNWAEDGPVTVTGEKPVLTVTGTRPDGQTIFTSLRRGARRATVTDQDGRAVILEFDSSGQLAWARSSARENYAFAYDDGRRLVSVTFPDGRAQTMAYDGEGRISAIEARNGGGVCFTYRWNETEVIEQAADGSQSRTVVKFR